MTDGQADIFEASTLGAFTHANLYSLITSVFWALMILWAAWTVVQALRGWWSSKLRPEEATGMMLRSIVLMIFLAIIVN